MKEEKNVLHFGIVGCGMIAAVHAEALRSVEGAVLVGVADANPAYAVALAERFGVTAYESYEQMLQDPMIDAVCVCTPSGFHAQNAIAALRAGKHTAVEKPIAMTAKDAEEVISVAKESGKILTVISQLRFAPDVVRLKKAVSEGTLGSIRLCDLVMKYWRDESYYGTSAWKGSRALDGGILMNQGIHGVDLLRYIMDDVKVLSSVTARLHHKIEAPDTALALLQYGCGALGTIEASTAAYPGFDLRLEIIGEKGYAMFHEDRLESLIINGEEQIEKTEHVSGGTAADPKAVGSKKHALQLQNFVSAINGECSLAVSGEDGRLAVALITDIYQEN